MGCCCAAEKQGAAPKGGGGGKRRKPGSSAPAAVPPSPPSSSSSPSSLSSSRASRRSSGGLSADNEITTHAATVAGSPAGPRDGVPSSLIVSNPLLLSSSLHPQPPQGGCLNEAPHRGVRWFCQTSLCGGTEAREKTITPCGRITSGKHPGVKVPSDSPFWHAAYGCFAPDTVYSVVTDDPGRKSTAAEEKYYPHPSDQFLVVLKAKTIGVRRDAGAAPSWVEVLPSHRKGTIMQNCVAASNPSDILPPEAEEVEEGEEEWCLRTNAGDLLPTVAYSDLSHGEVYELVPKERSFFVHGDRRMGGFPRSCPATPRVFEVKVPSGTSPSTAALQAAQLFLPPAALPPHLLKAAELVSFEDGRAVQRLECGLHAELRFPSKEIKVSAGGKSGTVAVPPGCTSFQLLSAAYRELGLCSPDPGEPTALDMRLKRFSYFKDGYCFEDPLVSPPTYETVVDGGEYRLVPAPMLKLVFDERDRDDAGISLVRAELVRLDRWRDEASRLFGAASRFVLSKRTWHTSDENTLVLYDEGEAADGFYKASVTSVDLHFSSEPLYTVTFTDGEVCPGVLGESIFQEVTGDEDHQIASKVEKSGVDGRLVVVASEKLITVVCPTKAADPFQCTILPGRQLREVISMAAAHFGFKKRVLRMADKTTAAQLRCRKSGARLTSITSLWHSVTDKMMFDLVLKPKTVSVTVYNDTERVVDVVVSASDTPSEVLSRIKSSGHCGLGAEWLLYKGPVHSESSHVVANPSWETLADGHHYVFRQANKHITIYVDSRVPLVDPVTRHKLSSTAVRQDMMVPPHVKAGELWRVIVVHPNLALSDTWQQLNLPSNKLWDSPSPSPVAEAGSGTLGIVSGTDIDGPCLQDLHGLSFSAIRNHSYYCVKYPDKLFKVVDREDRELTLFSSPGETHDVVCNRVKRACGKSEGWVLKDAAGRVVGSGETYKSSSRCAMDYVSIVAGSVYYLYRDIAVTIAGYQGHPPLDVRVPPLDSFKLLNVLRDHWSITERTSLSLRNAVTSAMTTPSYTHLFDGVTYELVVGE